MNTLWRKAHFWLAAVVSLFLLVSILTGTILSFEPIIAQQGKDISLETDVPLVDFLEVSQAKYPEILEVNRNKEGQFQLVIFPLEENQESEFLAHPITAEVIQESKIDTPFFDWVSSFHRSLFLHNTGRSLVGITSFLLLLIAISGFFLVLRKTGWRSFFKSLPKEEKQAYYHTKLGRWTLLPILAISLSGLVLSLVRFDLIPAGEERKETFVKQVGQEEPMAVFDMPDLQDISLQEVKRIEFPFSSDTSEFLRVELDDELFLIDQYSGKKRESVRIPWRESLKNFAFEWHTGQVSVIWAFVLFASCVSMLYFMYSGTRIALKRRRKGSLQKGVSKQKAETLILVGSENGNTKHFAEAVYSSLSTENLGVRIEVMNQFSGTYPKVKHLICLTSTYGTGQAPESASRFLDHLKAHTFTQSVDFSVVGFGSLLYPNFCQFAKEVQAALTEKENCHEKLAPVFIDRANQQPFQNWFTTWTELKGVKTNSLKINQVNSGKKTRFEVLEIVQEDDGTNKFVYLRLKTLTRKKVNSGDLLALLPADQNGEERFYSLGVNPKGELLISAKVHPEGKVSNLLYHLEKGQSITGRLEFNPNFHLDKIKGTAWMLANGTGIAPFLGMLHENKGAKKLVWGRRKFGVHQQAEILISSAQQRESLKEVYHALSRDNQDKSYVQDWIPVLFDEMFNDLQNGGILMICGSLKMKEGVYKQLDEMLESKGSNCAELEAQGRIKVDCY